MNTTVIGAGLAGCEAAWQLAERGVAVTLIEMKPRVMSPAHHSPLFAELVCSNSLRGNGLENAVGLLKEELRRLGSLILRTADATSVPAGGALAVDREAFAQAVTAAIRGHNNITVIEDEIKTIPDGEVIVASGPLTADALAQDIARRLGSSLFFFDAAAPIVTQESIDMDSAFWGSRYDKGTPDYINCPMDKPQYLTFADALAHAEQAQLHEFEDSRVFEGCLPIEVLARRGEDALRYGPLKPVGLRDPRGGERPYAVLQLRKDNAAGSLFNLVGCQTHLTFAEQKRVFGLIPALKNADYMRYGVMHRNTFIDSPRHLDCFFRLKAEPRIAFAGQMTGVEGYVESCASGLVAGLVKAYSLTGEVLPPLPLDTAIGALAGYVSNPAVTKFQPMNINFGLLPPLDVRIKDKRERYQAISARALAALEGWRGGGVQFNESLPN